VEDLYHPFRSETAKETYLAYYDQQARRWPIPSESRLVGTSFGQTFVRVSGPEDGFPLVLLPGDSENSLAWIPVIDALSAEHRTYALDHIFDNGRSVYARPMRTPDDFVQWLDGLFTALELHNINVIGHSYGGWQTSLYALAHPERLKKLVLLAPASTVLRPPLGLMVRAILYYFIPTRFVTKRYLYWYAPDAVRKDGTRATIDEMVDEQLLARKCFKRRKFIAPTVLTDQDWQKLQVPTLFLVGENDVTYSAHQAIRRLETVAPQVETSIAPEADHHLAIVKPDWVSDNVLKFLGSR
jgi:pimeloyl-ACP methyl ester carboxylesterase